MEQIRRIPSVWSEIPRVQEVHERGDGDTSECGEVRPSAAKGDRKTLGEDSGRS